MGRVADWWRRLTAARGRQQAAASPSSRRPAPQPASEEDALSIAPDPKPARRAARTGAAGFDPYSSDGGYAKPHSWERIDHD